MKYQPYRDESYQRPCEDRYEVLKKLACQFNRQFSVLDFGANYGWFGQRLVRDFDCVYVGVDNKTIDPHPRIWHINKHLNSQTLLDWSRSDTFDIVLGLAVLHHMDDPAIAMAGLKRLGRWVLFEIPGKNENKALSPEKHAGIRKAFDGCDPIAEFPSHLDPAIERPWYLYKAEQFIIEPSLDAAKRCVCGYATYKVFSDFDRLNIEIDRRPAKEAVERRPLIPGMNLHNFRLLGGEVDVPADDGLSDYRPWNFIIGDGIHRIDTFHDKR